MTLDSALSRLSAGLARDEAIARAAMPTPDTRWVLDEDNEVYSVSGGLDNPSRCDQHAPGQLNSCDDFPIGPDSDFDQQGHVAAHMVNFDPDRVLNQYIPAIRAVIAALNEADHGSGEPDPWALCSEIAEALAGLYEPTEEKP